MKRLAILAAVALSLGFAGAAKAKGPGEFKGPGNIELSDAYLTGGDFAYNFGPGSLVSVLDTVGDGAGFAIHGLTGGQGTGVSDNFPLSVSSGCTDTIFSGIYSDCTAFDRIVMNFTNLGANSVWVNVYMNTGFTAGGGLTTGCGGPNPACNTYWENGWTEVPPGSQNKVQVVLEFDNATPWNCEDDPDFVECDDGASQPIFRLEEVTNIGFQVADFADDDDPQPNVWVIVEGE